MNTEETKSIGDETEPGQVAGGDTHPDDERGMGPQDDAEVENGLKRFFVDGFMSLKRFELWPGRITVLIGPNGAGKSNILKAFRFVSKMHARVPQLRRTVAQSGGAYEILHRGSERMTAIRLELEFADEGIRQTYHARLRASNDEGLYFEDECVRCMPEDAAPMPSRSIGSSHRESNLAESSQSNHRHLKLQTQLRDLRYFHFHDTSALSPMRTNARLEDAERLHSDGRNLAAFLFRLMISENEEHTRSFARIQRLLRQVVPCVAQLEPAPLPENSNTVRLHWLDDRGERFGVHQLSDGTLRALALITLFTQPDEFLPGIACVDEPELGLHPAAVELVATLARSVSSQRQVLFATQSPEFLQHFEADEIRIVSMRDGVTRAELLDERRLGSWLEMYNVGEVFQKGLIGSGQ